jgi:predicted RNase H-like HicB family nuclease
MEKYLIVVEKSETGFSAYSPDVLGCIATGKTIADTVANMKSALRLHLRGLVEDNEEVPRPRGIDSYLDAERESEGEEYYITHIVVGSVLPEEALA